MGNLGRVEAEDLPWNGRPASVRLRVPPMGAVFLRPAQDSTGLTPRTAVE